MSPVLLRGSLAHVPDDPFSARGGAAMQIWDDAGLLVGEDGRIADLGAWTEVRARHPLAHVDDRSGALLLPGLVDAHVHYPQLPVIGAMGLGLLRWLEERALPFEARFQEAVFAREQARTFLRLLARNGTTSAMVFGAHFAVAMEAFFVEAEASGLRVTAGLNVADRALRPELHTTPEAAFEESSFLARRWHGRGRLRYAVTPRFSLSCSEGLLQACEAVAKGQDGLWVTSHLNENREEIEAVRGRFPAAGDYLATYEAFGMVGQRSVFAHDVHPSDDELLRLAAAGACVAHCASSNHFLGSGLFPMARHLAAGVRLALGSDVGAGTGLSILKEATAAYQGQMLLADAGVALGPAQLLWLATTSGAAALGLAGSVGDLLPGKEADLVVLRPPAGSTLAAAWAEAEGAEQRLALALTMAREESVESTWVAGKAVWDARP